MKKEVEIRFRLLTSKRKKILSILKGLKGIIWEDAIKEKDKYFCSSALVKKGNSKNTPYVLRIRESSKGNFLTYKSFLKDGFWIEKEVEIKDVSAMEKILNYLGQAPYLVIEKIRQRGKWGTIEINIDEIKELGTFIEIELQDEDARNARRKLVKLAKDRLGIKDSDVIHKGYVQLMEEAIEKKND